MNVRAIAVAMLATGAVACSSVRQTRPVAITPAGGVVTPAGMGIDHLIVSIDSLDRGIALLREVTGVTPVFGGAHPGRGTQNALLSLGSGMYLELLAPNPSDAAGPRMVQMFAPARSLTPTGWALRASDADSVRALAIRGGLPGGSVAPGARDRPDGSTLRWRTLSPWGSNLSMLPFFIEWHATSPHPSKESPGGCTLSSLTFASTAADSLRQLLGRVQVRANVIAAAKDSMSITLDCPKGRITF